MQPPAAKRYSAWSRPRKKARTKRGTRGEPCGTGEAKEAKEEREAREAREEREAGKAIRQFFGRHAVATQGTVATARGGGGDDDVWCLYWRQT